MTLSKKHYDTFLLQRAYSILFDEKQFLSRDEYLLFG